MFGATDKRLIVCKLSILVVFGVHQKVLDVSNRILPYVNPIEREGIGKVVDLEIDLAIHHLLATTSLLGILLLITVFFIFYSLFFLLRPPNGVWVDLQCS